MNDDIKKIYDFCEFRKNNADKNLEKIGDNIILSIQLVTIRATYWAIQRFILENFKDQIK